MIFGLLVLITALSISAVAIYYSVAGLMTIFAAAAIPIMIMGGALEIGKLVTAVWLHRYWSKATWWLKTYLTTAVLVLMFITSMGIFGFLSKAHIEQTASANEGVAQIERIDAEIARNEQIVARAETKIQELETSGTGASNQLQTQIDREQERIDSAYNRIQPAIEEQNQIIAGVTQLFQQELDRIDEELALLQSYIDAGEIAKAQAMVGARADGAFGPRTARAFTDFQDAKRAERNEWLQKIQDAAQSPTVTAARSEIQRLRASADEQIAQSNALINNLRNQLKSNDSNDLQTMLDEQNERVRTASSEIDTLYDQKFQLEAEYRKLEAEVGPVKYIAEFIYGETADNNLLEEAVRWVIIVIIFVFDPLAVLLLIASQYTFEFNRKTKPEDDDGERLRLEREEYEQARAQRIVDNPGYHTNDSAPLEEEEKVDEVTTEKEGSGDSAENTVGDGPAVGEDTTDTQRVSVEQDEDPQQDEERLKDVAKSYITNNDAVGDVVPEAGPTMADVSDRLLEQSEVQTDDPEVVEKKDIELSETEKSTEELQLREVELNESESLPEWQDAKTRWKQDHPTLSLKFFKNLYLEGKIDALPWQEYVQKKNYIMKQGNTQVKKETTVSESEGDNQVSGYIQNEEQDNTDALWNRIRSKNE
jgi:hypothetical protein